jgi:Arc/MetJ-type ribon-helix-helix transcriptional regulator
MPISVRLGTDLEARLAAVSRRLRVNKSEVIKLSVQAYLDQIAPGTTAFDRGQNLFGVDDTPGPSLAGNYKRLIKRKLGRKYAG